MKNPKVVKPIICLAALLCYLLPFFTLTVTGDSLFGDFGGFMSSLPLPGTGEVHFAISGISLFGILQFTGGILNLFGTIGEGAMVYLLLIMVWLAIPFIILFIMGIWNLLFQDRTTKILTITGGAINTVIFGVTLIYLVAKPLVVADAMRFTGSVGLWLLLIASIVMLVLGVYQKETAEVMGRGSRGYQTPAPAQGGGSLSGINGQYSGSNIPIEVGTELIIGRDASSCHLIVSGPKVSRKHCAVKYDMGTHSYRVIDYSTNGTYTADGKRLLANQYTSLPSGTTIYLGDQSVMFRLN